MFYDLNLLCPKRKGKFALIWIAATRGLAFVKKSIDNVDICQVCDEILKFVMSDSRSPRHRLSLYLSAKLIYGTVLVYHEQVKTLESQAVYFSVYIKRPVYRCISEDEEEDKNRKRLISRKRKPKKLTTNAENLQNEQMRDAPQIEQRTLREEINQNITDPIHITLPDEQFTRTHIPDVELFGDEGQIDLQLLQIEDITRVIPNPQPYPIPSLTIEQAQQSVSDKRQIEFVEDTELSPSKRRRTEIRPVSPVVRIEEHGILSPERQDQLLMPPPPPPVVPSPAARRSERLATLPDHVYGRDSPGYRRKGPRRLSFGSISPMEDQNEKLREIDFPLHKGTIVNLLSPKSFIPPRRSKSPIDIIVDILRTVAHTEEDVKEVYNETSTSSSRRLRTRIQNEQPEAIVVPNVEIPEPEIVPEELIPPQQEIIPDVPFIPSPRISRVQSEKNRSIPGEITEDGRGQRVYTSTPLGFETEARRHTLLLNHIRQLFMELGKETITIEMICQPLNRINVAKTFNGLLNLHAQRYIILKNNPNSVELKEICPGPRL